MACLKLASGRLRDLAACATGPGLVLGLFTESPLVETDLCRSALMTAGVSATYCTYPRRQLQYIHVCLSVKCDRGQHYGRLR